MNDIPEPDTNGSPAPPQTDAASPAPPGAPAKREPRPRVFGRFAFFITVVPFVFYLAGLMFASYIESSRAHTRVKRQTAVALEALRYLSSDDPNVPGRLEREFANRTAELEKLRNAWNLIAIKDMLREEDWEAERLEKVLDPLLDESTRPDYLEKREAREQVTVLLKMKQLEEQHKTREVLSLSHRHFSELQGESESLDSQKILTDTATAQEWFPPDKTWYPSTYAIVIAGTALLMLCAFPGYFKTRFSVSWLSVAVGVVGIVVWIGLVELDRRFLHAGTLFSPHGRDAFDPFVELKSNPTWMWQFMVIRFTGLVLIVPFVEEFFLRGWLMRYIDDPDWDEVPIGQAGQLAILGVVAYGVIAHLGEPLAAAAWFGLVTWLFLKTKSIWDCVVAHAVTNLLLGIFVVATGSWYLW